MRIVLYLIAGVVVLLGTVALYFNNGGDVPHDLNDWAAFGTYIAGIAGPLLSFLALIAVAHTVALQQEALSLEFDRQSADQQRRWLDELYNDIKEALDARLAPDVRLQDVLDLEVAASTVDQKRLALRLDNLMKLVADYCQAVALYRDNVSEFFDLQIYADRGARVLDSIKPFFEYLGNMSPITIELCDMNLRGDSERKGPEALTRSSRRR